jgi:hypothetical protein
VHLLHLIEGSTRQNLDNYTVEDNVLKQMIGFDPAVVSVDMLHKIFGKLGYVSQKYTKAVCLETIFKAYKDLQTYDAIQPSSNTNIDSTSVQYLLLNVIMSGAFVTHFQMLGARKEMAELDKGGAGQDKVFWEHVAVEFNEYDNDQYGPLVTTACNKKLFSDKNVNPSVKVSGNKSWESLQNSYLLTQKYYKKKYEQFKTSVNHESSFHYFCHGRLATYYLHICLHLHNVNTLEVVIEDLPEEVQYESTIEHDNNNDTNNNSLC